MTNAIKKRIYLAYMSGMIAVNVFLILGIVYSYGENAGFWKAVRIIEKRENDKHNEEISRNFVPPRVFPMKIRMTFEPNDGTTVSFSGHSFAEREVSLYTGERVATTDRNKNR